MPTELLFTADEANATLPKLRPLAQQLVQAAEDAIKATDLERPADIKDANARIRQAAEQIAARGVVIKDVRTSLFDYLCWMLGEGTVANWHPCDDGFAGRQPL